MAKREVSHIRRSVENSASKHKAAGDGFPTQLITGEINAIQIDVVGAVKKDIMDACHSSVQGYQGQGGHAILSKQTFGPDEAAGNAQQDDESTEGGRPPANEQRRFIMLEFMKRWRFRVECHGYFGNPRSSSSSEGPDERGERVRFRWTFV